MLRTSKWFVAAAVVLLAGQACFAGFTGDLTMTAGLTDLNNVPGGSTLTFTVMDAQSYNSAGDGSSITLFQLNFDASSAGIKAALQSGTWTWDPALASLNSTVDSSLSDLIVATVGASGVKPGSPFALGTLSFTAPSTPGTYTLRLTGGDGGATPDPTNTWIGSTGTAWIDSTASTNGTGGLVLENKQFTVLPEPATLALLGLGGLAALLRRRSR